MTGQLIVLPGVNSGAGAGAPRIDMSAGDVAACRIPSLKHAVAARDLTGLAGGGVAGFCRNTGQALEAKGSAAGQAIGDVAGIPALVGTGTVASSLALPADSLTKSYTVVAAVHRSSVDDAAGSRIVNFISGASPVGDYSAWILRGYGPGSTDPANANMMTSNGASTSGSPAVRVSRPVGPWVIAVVSFDGDSRILSISVDGGAPVHSAALSRPDPESGSYLEIGLQSSVASLCTSAVGDLYTFDESLMRTPFGRYQLSELVDALKADYGIS